MTSRKTQQYAASSRMITPLPLDLILLVGRLLLDQHAYASLACLTVLNRQCYDLLLPLLYRLVCLSTITAGERFFSVFDPHLPDLRRLIYSKASRENHTDAALIARESHPSPSSVLQLRRHLRVLYLGALVRHLEIRLDQASLLSSLLTSTPGDDRYQTFLNSDHDSRPSTSFHHLFRRRTRPSDSFHLIFSSLDTLLLDTHEYSRSLVEDAPSENKAQYDAHVLLVVNGFIQCIVAKHTRWQHLIAVNGRERQQWQPLTANEHPAVQDAIMSLVITITVPRNWLSMSLRHSRGTSSPRAGMVNANMELVSGEAGPQGEDSPADLNAFKDIARSIETQLTRESLEPALSYELPTLIPCSDASAHAVHWQQLARSSVSHYVVDDLRRHLRQKDAQHAKASELSTLLVDMAYGYHPPDAPAGDQYEIMDQHRELAGKLTDLAILDKQGLIKLRVVLLPDRWEGDEWREWVMSDQPGGGKGLLQDLRDIAE